jgi:hypothetical protein
MRTISSPLAIRSRSVETIGRPAPTLASNRKWRLRAASASISVA